MDKVDGHHEGEPSVSLDFLPFTIYHHFHQSHPFFHFPFSYRGSRYSYFLTFPIKVYLPVTWKKILNSYNTSCQKALNSSAASLCPRVLAFMVWYGMGRRRTEGLVVKCCHTHDTLHTLYPVERAKASREGSMGGTREELDIWFRAIISAQLLKLAPVALFPRLDLLSSSIRGGVKN